MSDPIKHECGIAAIRLLKPLDFYYKKYGTPLYALNKMYLMMEKQHNRGHDGAGLATIKFNTAPGSRYIALERSNSSNPIKDIFRNIHSQIKNACKKMPGIATDAYWMKNNVNFCGELYLGHLRYGTFGKNDINTCHPFLRENNWLSRTLLLAGNFNLTNVDELFELLVDIGQHPIDKSDTVTILEKIGHFLDEANQALYRQYKSEGYDKHEIAPLIAENIDITKILKESCKKWDGGFVIAGLLGHGDAFVLRDPSGIRPAYYYVDDEVAVVTSERPAIQTAFDVPINSIQELKPAHALIIKKDGTISETPFMDKSARKACSFERIYFSRGTDADIYRERKALGKYVTRDILKEIDYDLDNAVFFIYTQYG